MTDTVRKILLIVLVAVFIATCLAFTITSLDGGGGKDFYNPVAGANSDNAAYQGKYIISVTSAGGLALDGVRVHAKLGGQTVMTGISQNGKIEMTVSANDYDLIVDESSLPEGYFIPDGASFKTQASKASAKIELPSRVINKTASSGTLYRLGDVMYDFSFTEVGGGRFTLSEVLAQKKAVMLNFWYAACIPCQSEFPAIEKVYKEYSDRLGIIALSNQDSANAIATFKRDHNLTFNMAPDQAGVTGLFGVTAFPTTVMIDRYGVVAYSYTSAETSESVWRSLFNKYTSDDYTQAEKPSEDDPTDFVKPQSTAMPPTEDIEAVALDASAVGKATNFHAESNAKDAPYSWPWLVGERDGLNCVYASNAGQDFTYATMYFNVALQSSKMLSYDYDIKSESGNDVLFVFVDGSLVAEHSGNSEGWQTQLGVYVADRSSNVQVAFLYRKDQKQSVDGEVVAIRNIAVSDVRSASTAVDQRTAATDGLTLSSDKKYGVTLLEPQTAQNPDIFYKVAYTDENGNTSYSILFADILNSTLWSEKHVGAPRIDTPESFSTVASMYQISYWYLSNYQDRKQDDDNFRLSFKYGSSSEVIDSYYLQLFSDNKLLPVTKSLKTVLTSFAKEFCRSARKYCAEKNISYKASSLEYYEDQWLELCFYFKHFGTPAEDGKHSDGAVCNALANPVAGLNYKNAFTINKSDNVLEEVNITKIITRDGGGIWYKFVPDKTDVYHFYSTRSEKQTCDPALALYAADGSFIDYNDWDERFNRTFTKESDDFNMYAVLEGGKEYRVQATLSYAQGTGDYTLHIDNVGDSYSFLRVASTDDGTWADTGRYNGIEVGYDQNGTGFWHAIEVQLDNEGKVVDRYLGEVVYINFISPNYYDINNNTLFDMIKGGIFDFTKRGGTDYTQELYEYYYKACENKEQTDELYGLIEADERLVQILNDLIKYSPEFGDGPSAFAWLMFACYYERYHI